MNEGTSFTPREVEAEICRLVRLLDHQTSETAKRARASAAADIAFRGAWALALAAAEGKNGPEREAVAATATMDVWGDKRNAEAVLWAATEAGRNIRAQLDALRSVNTNLREVVIHGGGS
jgi:hypothetical protein